MEGNLCREREPHAPRVPPSLVQLAVQSEDDSHLVVTLGVGQFGLADEFGPRFIVCVDAGTDPYPILDNAFKHFVGRVIPSIELEFL